MAGSISGRRRPIAILTICRQYFQLPGDHHIGTHRPELGESICALPFERHVIYFLQTEAVVIVIRVLSQHQDAGRHLHWR